MQEIRIGDVTITSIIERDGPWRAPEAMFPDYNPEVGDAHLAELDPVVYDAASNRMVITYQTFVIRTPHHTILVDTCTGEDKGYPAPMDFPKQPWLDGFNAAGLRFEQIDYVFCTHLHIDHCGWNTVLRDGRWVPTFPHAKYVFHKREYAAWEAADQRGENPPGNVWRYNCEPIVAAGQALLVDDDYVLDDLISLTPFLRARAHVALHQTEIGIVDYQMILSHRGITLVVGSNVYPMAELGVARAFAESGDQSNSQAAYQRFAELWNGADRRQPMMVEALAKGR